ncbi:MAG: type I-MYXAN CRISPR-associated protein Cas5/Cmx5/DevS [Planctomycetes bacterium]|nr:type I-MYXAN CRISPR-associated protein Cas5/Cmx5/DevS [Planctomycetota bacterium]
MLGLIVRVPIACWRKGHARDYLESEPLPPPSTCYGFLLALVGEENRRRHIGARVTAGILVAGHTSVVLRTLWRVKSKGVPQGVGGNARPDFQQLVVGSMLTMWVDRGDESGERPCLEERVRSALADPSTISRFGGLSLGESTHLVDSVNAIKDEVPMAENFVVATRGRLTLPVWVDHVGTANTRHVVGDLVTSRRPDPALLPTIAPPNPDH